VFGLTVSYSQLPVLILMEAFLRARYFTSRRFYTPPEYCMREHLSYSYAHPVLITRPTQLEM
jgi:hypothetical protein